MYTKLHSTIFPADFGIARILEAGQSAGTFCGTFPYMVTD